MRANNLRRAAPLKVVNDLKEPSSPGDNGHPFDQTYDLLEISIVKRHFPTIWHYDEFDSGCLVVVVAKIFAKLFEQINLNGVFSARGDQALEQTLCKSAGSASIAGDQICAIKPDPHYDSRARTSLIAVQTVSICASEIE